MRALLPNFLEQLNSFSKSQLKQLRLKEGKLADIPREPFPDKAVMEDSDALTNDGRASARQYHRTGACDQVTLPDGTRVYAMPQTLATWNAADSVWKFTDDAQVKRVHPGTARKVLATTRAKSSEELSIALSDLGAADPPQSDMNLLLKVVSEHVLVLHGPGARQYWCHPDAEATPYPDSVYVLLHFLCARLL